MSSREGRSDKLTIPLPHDPAAPSTEVLEQASRVLRAILSALDTSAVRYAVIHHAEDLDSQLVSDIDIILDRHPAEALEPVLAAMPEVRVVQRLHYEIPYGFYYVLDISSNTPCFLHLDVVFDPWGCNHYLYTSEALLVDRRMHAGIWTTAPAKEAAYLLIKKAVKGGIDPQTRDLILKQVDHDPVAGRREVIRWFGVAGLDVVQRLGAAQTPAEWNPVLKELRARLGGALRRRGGLLGMRRIALEAHRRLSRIIHPTGLFVVAIGPDGSGKSTLVEGSLAALKRGFRATWRFHWRPGLLPKPGASASSGQSASNAPPDSYSYGRVVSWARYLYYLVDFVIGYWLVIYPKKVRTTLIFGERWYYDVIVNPARYGFRVPGWMLRAGRRLVPEPNLTVLLEAPPAVIHARKPELTIEQLETQLRIMRAVLPPPPVGLRISTSGSIEESVRILTRAVLDTAQSNTVLARGSAIERRNEWRAFPNTTNTKLWIHVRDPIANALHLYHPYSRPARMAARIAAYLPRVLTTRRLPSAEILRLSRLSEHIQRLLGHDDLVTSFSTGTPGAHRKITAQVSHHGEIIAYVKIGSSDAAKKLMEAEALALARLDPAALAAGVSAPRVLARVAMDDSLLLALSAPPSPGRQRPTMLDEHDIRFLASLVPPQPRVQPLAHVLDAIGLGEESRAAPGGHPEVIRHACEAVAVRLGRGVRIGPAHGDYAPWNTLVLDDGSLYVFDWEHAADASLLSDLFHRVFMPDRLVHRVSPRVAVSRLLALAETPLTRPIPEKCGIEPAEFPAYLLLYFLQLATRETLEQGAVSDYLRECIQQTLAFLGHPAYRPRVLVSAYACEPHKGSEPGVGWSWVLEIANDHDAWVITRANNRESIEMELRANPNPHLHFAYVDLPGWARFWKRKHRGIRTYYYLWQFAAWRCARKLQREMHFDLAHHVTFVNDWLWTFLALMPLPYVWGPIGSNARCPSDLLPHSRARRTDLLRVLIQSTVRWLDPLWWLSAIRAAVVVTINEETARQMPLHWVAGGRTSIEPAVAVDPAPAFDAVPQREGTRILYVGRHLPVKGGALAVEAFARIIHRAPHARLTLIGEGPEEQDLRRRTRGHGIEQHVEFRPWQPQDQVWRAMETADIFLFPSMEGAGMVVLEAMRAGLPVVCLKFGGPGTMVTEETGCRVPVGPFDRVADELAAELLKLLDDPPRRRQLGEAARRRAQNAFSWEAKRLSVRRWYRDVLYPGSTALSDAILQAESSGCD